VEKGSTVEHNTVHARITLLHPTEHSSEFLL